MERNTLKKALSGLFVINNKKNLFLAFFYQLSVVQQLFLF